MSRSPVAPSLGASNPASPGDSDGGTQMKKSPTKRSAAGLMKKLKSNMDTAYSKLPEGMLEGEDLHLNRWSVLIEDATLKELGLLNRYRVRQSEEAKKQSVLALTGAKKRTRQQPLGNSGNGDEGKALSVLSKIQKGSQGGTEEKGPEVDNIDEDENRVKDSTTGEITTSGATNKFFEGLKSLQINGAERVTDYGLAQVGRNCPTLTNIDLGNCSNVTDVGLRELAIGCPLLRSLNLEKCSKVKNVGIVAVGQYCTGMTKLNLTNNWKLEPWLLARIAEFRKLVHLDLTRCVQCTDKTLKAIGNHCHDLKVLNLTGDKLISDVGLLELTKGCGKLETLIMPRSALFFKITDVALLTLADRAPGLTKLDISGNELITDVGMDWLAAGCNSLTDLNLSGLFKLTDAGLRCLSEGCVDLKKLDLSGLRYCTDIGIRHLSSGCKKLENLILNGIYLLSNGMNRNFGLEGLQALSQECHSIRMISLANCFQISARVVTALSKGCPLLEDVRFAGCSKIDAECVRALATFCPGIKVISFCGCSSLDSQAIAHLAKKCSGITSANLSQCENIADSAVQALAKHCKGMLNLNVAQCRQVTDYSLLAISEAELVPGLTSLNLESTEVTDTGITWLAERCTSLLNLTLTRCGNVSYAGVKAIRESWKHVELIKTEVYFGLKPAHRGVDKRYIDEFGAVWKAATKIQSIYRAKMARREMAIKREEYLRHWVATHLQAVWRGRKARRYAIMKRMQRNREEEAALKMQCAFRARRARRVMELRRAEAGRRKAIWAACLVQRNYRGKLARRWFLAQKQAQEEFLIRCNEAALMVQSAWRGRQARRRAALQRAMNSLQARAEENAARMVQRIYRGKIARKILKRKQLLKRILGNKEEESAVKIQTLFRERMKWRRKNAARDLDQRRNKAATKLQGMFRARKGRKLVHMRRELLRAKREEAAAIKMQNAWRRKQGRMIANMLRRGKLIQAEEEDKAARLIQKVYRGHRGRKRVKRLSQQAYMDQKRQENLEEWAALQLQRMFRGRLGRLRFAARQVEVARRWKVMFDENQGRVFYYNMGTGEIRWRKPQELLELDPRPTCDNCAVEEATVECGQCTEFFCAECWDAVHFGGKRKAHKFRCLYDYYSRRIDYGDGEFPSQWPTEIEQDDLYGWHQRGEDPRAKSRGGASSGAMVTAGASLSLPLEHVEKWTKYWDEPSAAFFYFNSETNESTYDRPESYRSEAGNDKPGDQDKLNGGFEKYMDEENQRPFYYNPDSGESTYERPQNFATPVPSARLEDPSSLSSGSSLLSSSQQDAGWEKHWSDQWNLHYFHNVNTGVSTFDRPANYQTPVPTPRNNQLAIESGQGGWVKYWDDESEAEFYFHEESGMSQFERPIEYNSPAPTPRNGAQSVPDLTLSANPTWAKYYDDAAQAYYYYDSATGESTYDRPAFFQTPR